MSASMPTMSRWDRKRRVELAARWYVWLTWAVVVVCGIVLLVGWPTGAQRLIRILPSYPAMVPETAITLGAVALGLIQYRRSGSRVGIVLAASMIAVVLAAHQFLGELPIVEMFGWTLSLVDDQSRATQVGLILLAGCLVLLALDNGQLSLAVTRLATLGLVLTLIPIFGYIYDSEALFSVPAYSAIALHTALSLMALFIAILLLHPEIGWQQVLFADERGSDMARRVLPTILTGSVLLCYLALMASRHDLMARDFRVAVLALGMVMTSSVFVVLFARMTNRAERKSRETREALYSSDLALQESLNIATHAQRVDALGRLVGGVAHDFNNILTVIMGNLELLVHDKESERRDDYVAEATAAAAQAAHLTQQLLAYGRRTNLAPEPINVNAQIEGFETMLRRVLPANVTLAIELQPNIAEVVVDPAQFQQALLNLVINARDAVGESGRIRVATSVVALDAAERTWLSTGEGLAPGRYVQVGVHDNGAGMTPEVLAKATEPFFTTKDVGDGTGLGLSMVYGFCRQSNGALRLLSAPGQGSEVDMLFKASAESGNARSVEAAAPKPPTGTPDAALILIVEDGAAVARILGRQLSLAGHEVIFADSGDAALQMIDAGATPDVVLSDMVMPGRVQGHHLAEILRERKSGIRVILMSGYQSETTRKSHPALRDLAFLQKPIDRATLFAAIHAALINPQDGRE